MAGKIWRHGCFDDVSVERTGSGSAVSPAGAGAKGGVRKRYFCSLVVQGQKKQYNGQILLYIDKTNMSQTPTEHDFRVTSTNPIHMENLHTKGNIETQYSTEATTPPEPSYPLHLIPSANSEFLDYGQLMQLRKLPITGHTVITGIMGSGKTESVLAYAQEVKSQYELIAHIEASSKEKIEQSLYQLAKTLGITGLTRTGCIDALKAKLQQFQSPFLLIFDNVINSEELRAYLPKTGNGHQIIISQRSAKETWNGTVIALKKPNQTEALVLLQKLVGTALSAQEQELMPALVDALYHLPLAIKLAANLLVTKKINIADCLDLIKSKPWALFERHDIQNNRTLLQTLHNMIVGLAESESKVLEGVIACPEGKLQKELGGLAILKPVGSLIDRGLLMRSNNQILSTHPIVSAIFQHKQDIATWLEAQNAKTAQAVTHMVPTLTGPLNASEAPTTSYQMLVNSGQAFFGVQNQFTFPNGGDFSLSDDGVRRLIEVQQVSAQQRVVTFNSITPIAAPKFPIHYLPAQNTLFIDWNENLLAMQDRLTANQGIVLTGMAGLGKSALASAYTYQNLDAFDLIFIIQAHHPKALLESYKQLGSSLNVFAQNGETDADYLLRVNTTLQHLEKNFLLLFDGAKTPASLLECIPNCAHGKIIITSRCSKGWQYPQLAIKLPTVTEAKDFFKISWQEYAHRKTPINATDLEIEALVHNLGLIPASIEQAAKHIARSNIYVKQYMTYFSTERRELWGHETALKTSILKIQEAWDAEYEALEPLAQEVLHYLASQTSAHCSEASLWAHFADKPQVHDVCTFLCDHNLISKNEAMFHMNPFLQLVIQDKMLASNASTSTNFRP